MAGDLSARQNLDRYMALARAAAASGDAVASERYYQFAEHYRRQLNGLSD